MQMDSQSLRLAVSSEYRKIIRFRLSNIEEQGIFDAWCSHGDIIGQKDQIVWYSSWFGTSDSMQCPTDIQRDIDIIAKHGREFFTAMDNSSDEITSITWEDDGNILWNVLLRYLPENKIFWTIAIIKDPCRKKITPNMDISYCPITSTTIKTLFECYISYVSANSGTYPDKIAWYKRWFFNDILILNYQRRFPKISHRFDISVIQKHIEHEMKSWSEISADSNTEYKISTWELDGDILWCILNRICPNMDSHINIALSPKRKKTRRSFFHKEKT